MVEAMRPVTKDLPTPPLPLTMAMTFLRSYHLILRKNL